MEYFKRTWKVNFPSLGIYFENDLYFSFEIEKDLTQQTNKAKIVLKNLSDDTREKMDEPDLTVEVYAGYEKNSGAVLAFVGNIIQVDTREDENDVTTTLSLSDGQKEIRDTLLSLSYPPGTPSEPIIREIGRRMGTACTIEDGCLRQVWRDGYSYVGTPKAALSEVSGANMATWTIQNGILTLMNNGGYATKRGLVFGKDSGLIGHPERINKANNETDTATRKKKRRKEQGKEKNRAGWKIKTLLAPTVNAGDLVKVESRAVTGWMRVEKIRHAGQSIGGDWLSEMELSEQGEPDEQ